MAVWATHPRGHPAVTVHRMTDDAWGRPSDPVCGRELTGLLLWAWTDWVDVPIEQRCARCQNDERPPPEGGGAIAGFS